MRKRDPLFLVRKGAIPYWNLVVTRRVPHLRDGFIVAKVGESRESATRSFSSEKGDPVLESRR